eukprot:7005360-Pyramimonas_sp.AAC.1
MMIETARFARDRILRGRPTDPLSRYIACRTIARTLWSQDIQLAEKIRLSHPFGEQSLVTDPLERTVSLSDPNMFQAASDEAHLAMFAQAQAEARRQLQQEGTPESVRRKLRKRLKSLQVRCKLWSPFDRKLPLQGTRVSQGPGSAPNVRADPGGMMNGLSEYWGGAFA